MPYIALEPHLPGITGFFRYRRYVDSLDTCTFTDPAFWKERGRKIAEETGYAQASPYR